MNTRHFGGTQMTLFAATLTTMALLARRVPAGFI
jgi:hypothetical protein